MMGRGYYAGPEIAGILRLIGAAGGGLDEAEQWFSECYTIEEIRDNLVARRRAEAPQQRTEPPQRAPANSWADMHAANAERLAQWQKPR